MKKVYTQLSTGLPGLDTVLGGIRPGDNIVLQVGAIEDYQRFVEPFALRAHQEQRKLIYFRFADHPKLISLSTAAQVHKLSPQIGFAKFIDKIFRVIEDTGIGACYVFDSMSELAVDWYSDRMLANFFMLVCPYLYTFETASYFALLRNRNTSYATEAVHSTAQIVMDVFKKEDVFYVHPLKVYKRHSKTMYMLHRQQEDRFVPVTESMVTAEILSQVERPHTDLTTDDRDVWTKVFIKARDSLESSADKTPAVVKDKQLLQNLIRMALTREPKMIELAEKYFAVSDIIQTGRRIIGTGLIGGKAFGMLLARAVLKRKNPAWSEKLEMHDSFFVGAHVFYTYLVKNGCWWVHDKMRGPELDFDGAQEAKQRLLTGSFPDDIRERFAAMLDYFGQSPIIVRSSSVLEHTFSTPFSGRYDSVFCPNQGTPQERLDHFMAAARTVYASVMNREALLYRKQTGLLDRDEQMGLLVQRVSGQFYDSFFFPHLAGCGYSLNPFAWDAGMDKKAGFLRLVAGLGTRASGICDDDTIRLVCLSRPDRYPGIGHDPGQQKADVIDFSKNRVATLLPDQALPSCRELEKALLFSNNRICLNRIIEKTDLVSDMREMLTTLQKAYGCPVEAEFTVNFQTPERFRINLLHCRPFQAAKEAEKPPAQPRISAEKIILKSSGPVIGSSLDTALDRIIYIVPEGYRSAGVDERYELARLLGQIIALHRADGQQRVLLAGPGRWGALDPLKGVPVTFAEISALTALCEFAEENRRLLPESCLGNRFFNAIIESGIVYAAVLPDNADHVLNAAFFENSPNRLPDLMPAAGARSDTIRIIDPPQAGIRLYVNSDKEKMMVYKNS